VFEALDLFDQQTYWKKYNRFTAYCNIQFQDQKKKTKEVVAEEKKQPILPTFNETFSFDVYELHNFF
jgi:hypothetical protein